MKPYGPVVPLIPLPLTRVRAFNVWGLKDPLLLSLHKSHSDFL